MSSTDRLNRLVKEQMTTANWTAIEKYGYHCASMSCVRWMDCLQNELREKMCVLHLTAEYCFGHCTTNGHTHTHTDNAEKLTIYSEIKKNVTQKQWTNQNETKTKRVYVSRIERQTASITNWKHNEQQCSLKVSSKWNAHCHQEQFQLMRSAGTHGTRWTKMDTAYKAYKRTVPNLVSCTKMR